MNENPICPFTHLPCTERCAWYEEDRMACAVLVLAKEAKKVTKNVR